MESKENKTLNRYYIQAAIKNRSYVGYRVDVEIIKILIVVFLLFFGIRLSESYIVGALIGIQGYAVGSLVLEWHINRKIAAGKKIVENNLKNKFFSDKLFLSCCEEFDRFIKLYLNFNRYRDVKKIGKYKYRCKKNNETCVFVVFKYYQGAWIDKIDVRCVVNYAIKRHEKCALIALNEPTEEAKELLEKHQSLVELIEYKDLYEFAVNNDLLPEKNLGQIDVEKVKVCKKINRLADNILLDGKIMIYPVAAIGFNFLYVILGGKIIFLLAAIYFVVITIVVAISRMVKSRNKNSA